MSELAYKNHQELQPMRESQLSKVLVWMKQEIEAVGVITSTPFDTKASRSDLHETVKRLTTQFRRLDSLVNAIREYKESLKQATQQQTDQYLSGVKEYLNQQGNAKPVPIALPRLSDELEQVDQVQLDFFDGYLHDLSTLIQSTGITLLDSFEYYSGLPDDGSKEENLQEIANSLHALLLEIAEFHHAYDMENLTYVLTPSPVLASSGVLSKFFPSHKNLTEGVVPKPVRLSLQDDTKRYFKEVLGVKTSGINVKSNPLDAYTSLFSAPFVTNVASNIFQNLRRINAKVENSQHISEVTCKVEYVAGFGDLAKQVENQVEENGKGVWMVVTIQDNGKGFPVSESSEKIELFGHEVAVFNPEKGKSTHQGEGVGLATIKSNVEAAGGMCVFYNSNEHPGASTTIAFPLVHNA